MKKLKLHTLPPTDDFDVKVGDEFEVVGEEEVAGLDILFVEIDGYPLGFTVQEDPEGSSLHDWFTIIETEAK